MARGTRQHRTRALLLAAPALALLLALGLALRPAATSAHPLGNFTVSRYARLDFASDAVTLTYALDFAEIPTFQELEFIDTDGDTRMSPAEAEAYLGWKLPQLLERLRLVVGDELLVLEPLSSSAALAEGQGGLPTLRIDATLRAELPDGWQEDGFGGYTDRNYEDRLGWREVVVRGGEGVAIASSSAPAVDLSDSLRSYPEDRLADPLNLAEATFTLAAGNGAAAVDTAGQAAERVQARDDRTPTDRVAALITARELSPMVVLASLGLAMFWGAVHALSPGHGKTVVAAYLIGARGTARHAAFLGLTVTLTHTAGVFALGVVTLWLSRYILPEELYPWLSVASGVLVVVLGVTLFLARLRGARRGEGDDGHHGHDHDHAHAHDHAHPHDHAHEHHGAFVHTHDGHTHSHLPPGADGSRVTWRSLLALGVSGGLVPCPSALVLLLGAISLDRLELGMLLVLAFSFGLAIVLTAIGLLFVYARRFVERRALAPKVPRLLPAFSALAVCIAGVAIVVGSLEQAGII